MECCSVDTPHTVGIANPSLQTDTDTSKLRAVFKALFSAKEATCIKQLSALKWHPSIPNVVAVLDGMSSKLFIFDIVIMQEMNLLLDSIEVPSYLIDLEEVPSLKPQTHSQTGNFVDFEFIRSGESSILSFSVLLLNEKGRIYSLGPFVFQSTPITDDLCSSLESAIHQLSDKLFRKPLVNVFVDQFLRPLKDYCDKNIRLELDGTNETPDASKFKVLKSSIARHKLSQMPIRVTPSDQKTVPTNPTKLLVKLVGEFVLLMIIDNTGDTFLYCTASHLSLLIQEISKDEELVYLGYIILSSKEEKYNAALTHRELVMSKDTLSVGYYDDILLISVFNQQIYSINLSWLSDCLQNLLLDEKPTASMKELMSKNLVASCSVVAKDPMLQGAFLLRKLILTFNQSWQVRIYLLKKTYSLPVNTSKSEDTSKLACLDMMERLTRLQTVEELIEELAQLHRKILTSASVSKMKESVGIGMFKSNSLSDLQAGVSRLTQDIEYELKSLHKQHEINSTHFISGYYQVEKLQDENQQLKKRLGTRLNTIESKNKSIEEKITRLEKLTDLQIPLEMRVTVSNTLEELNDTHLKAVKTDITNVTRSNQDEAKHRAAPQTAAAAGGRERFDRGRGTLLD